MSESIETSDGILAGVEEEKVVRENRREKPKKAKYTPVTFESLRKNVRMGKLPEKIRQYNEEYARLVELAKTVNEGRGKAEEKAEGEERELAYAEVSKTIEAYNAQAAKLADLGVQVLAFDSGIRRIEKEENKNARAIKVPKFVINALDALGLASANKIKEGMAERERAQAMLAQDVHDAILTAAEEAIGQDAKEGTVSKAALDSLAYRDDVEGKKVLSQTIYDSLRNQVVEETATVAPPQSDVSEVIDPAAIAKGAGAEAAKKSVGKVSDRVIEKIEEAKRANKEFVDETLAKELEGSFKQFLSSEDLFDAFKNLDGKFYLKTDEDAKKIMFRLASGDRVALSPELLVDYVQKVIPDEANTDIEAAQEFLNSFATVLKSVEDWSIATGFLNDFSGNAFDESERELFNAVVGAIREGKTEAEIIEVGKSVANNVDGIEYALSFCTGHSFKEGVMLCDEGFGFGTSIAIEEPVVEEEPISVDVNKVKAQVTEETLRKLANGMRLNRAEGMDPVVFGIENQPVVEPVQPVVEETPVVAPVVEPVQPVVSPENVSQNDNISRLNEISTEIATLSQVKNNLINSGVNDSELMAKIDANIRELTSRMSSLLDSNIVELGAQREEPVNEVVSEATPVVTEPTAEERHADDIVWWNNLGSILDDPKQNVLSEMEIARHEKELAERRAQDAVEKVDFDAQREAIIAANRERTAVLRERREQLREELVREHARDVLSYIGRGDERAYSDEDIAGMEDPVAFLDELRNLAPTEVARAEARLEEARNAIQEVPVVEAAIDGVDGLNNANNIVEETVSELDESVVLPKELSNDDASYHNDNQQDVAPVVEETIKTDSVVSENIDLIMDLIVDDKNMDHRYDSETISREFFDENPSVREQYESQYIQAAGPNFWEAVANGYTPISSTNVAVERVRLDRKAQAARDFLGFAYSLDDEMLDTMERSGETPLHVVNSLPKEDVERNLESYARYLDAKRERVEAERSALR